MSEQHPFWANRSELRLSYEKGLRRSWMLCHVVALLLIILAIYTRWPTFERNYVLVSRISALLDTTYTKDLIGLSFLQARQSTVLPPCTTIVFSAPQCTRTLMASVDAGATLDTIKVPLDALNDHPAELSIIASYAGEVWYRSGRKDEALTVWLSWLGPLQRIDIASRLFNAGNKDDALILINSLDPKVRIESGVRRGALIRILIPSAQSSSKNQDHNEAENYWRRATLQYPERAGYYFNLAVALQSQDKFEEALIPLREAVQLQPTNASYQLRLSLALEKLENHLESKQVAQRVLVLDPKNQTARRILEQELEP